MLQHILYDQYILASALVSTLSHVHRVHWHVGVCERLREAEKLINFDRTSCQDTFNTNCQDTFEMS